jgi:hypothetical protein
MGILVFFHGVLVKPSGVPVPRFPLRILSPGRPADWQSAHFTSKHLLASLESFRPARGSANFGESIRLSPAMIFVELLSLRVL